VSEQLSDALAVMAMLVIEDGRRWGDAATPAQRLDAEAVLDPDLPTPYHFETRSRGFAKTDDAAGLSMAIMLTQAAPGSRLYWLAADKDQGRLAIDSAQGFVARTPEIAGAFNVDSWKVTVPGVGSTLEVLAADAPGAFGLRPSWLVCDELAQWGSTEGPRRLFDATTSALTKVPGARCLIITSAGDPAHWSYRVLEHARADPLWRTHEVAGASPWIDHARLEEQRRRLMPSQFARLFLNEWTASEDRLTTRDDVLACVGHSGDLEPSSRHRYVITLDIGLVHDRTVACVAHRDGRVVVDRLHVWAGTRTNPVRLDEVEEWLYAAAKAYRAPLLYDPFQAALLTQRLKARGVRVQDFTFSSSSVGRLAVALFNALREHALDLPDDEALIDELANIRLRETTPGVVRLDHDSGQHDDRAIALSLAISHLTERQPRMIRGWTAARYKIDPIDSRG
jgi:phage terminase large subunit-like protein